MSLGDLEIWRRFFTMEDKHPANERKVRFRPNVVGSKKEGKSWIVIMVVVSFFISAFLSFTAKRVLSDVNTFVAFGIVLVIICIGIVFDIIGISVTAADEAPFHAMASRKLYGARQAIRLIRNANKVSSFCNDVVGDICGVISGTASAFIILKVAGESDSTEATVTGLVISGLVASLTIGGKAMGKTLAIQYSNFIVYKVGVILKFLIGRISIVNVKRKARK